MAGQGPLQLFDALAGYGADFVELQLLALDVGTELFELVGLALSILVAQTIICLPARGDRSRGRAVVHGVGCAGGGETVELLVDDFEVFDGVGAAAGVADVDEVEQEAGALDVARNWTPRPEPRWAPSMRPGMSATT